MNKLISVLLLIFLFSCNKKEEIKPFHQDIKELVFASGLLEWEDAYHVTAQTDGVLKNVNFEVGNTVAVSQVLATIDNPTNYINSQVAQEQLAISNENITVNAPGLQLLQQNILFAESKYQQDQKNAARYERLHQSNIGSQVEYENAQLNAKNALANLNALRKQYAQVLQQAKQQQIANKAQYKNSQIIQNYNSIVATEGGTVIEKLKNNGDYVRKGDMIATIANQQKVVAVLNVDENSISKVALGQTVFVKLNTNKSETYNGKISEILSAFDLQTQSFICKVTFEKPFKNSLFGTQLEANILIGEKKNALLIPRLYMGFGNKVNVKGKDEPVVIQPGIIATDYVEVLGGIDQNSVLIPLKP